VQTEAALGAEIKWGIVSRNKLREVDLKDPADAKAMVGSFFVGQRHRGQRSETRTAAPTPGQTRSDYEQHFSQMHQQKNAPPPGPVLRG
jgi:hypothetical protein